MLGLPEEEQYRLLWVKYGLSEEKAKALKGKGFSYYDLDKGSMYAYVAQKPLEEVLELRRENPVLCTLYPGGDERGRVPIRLDSGLRTQVADNCAHEQLAAALYGLGIAPAQRFLGEITC